jgi:hypothetical protein
MLGVRCEGELPAKAIDFCGAEGGFDANSAARQRNWKVVHRGEVCACSIKIEFQAGILKRASRFQHLWNR